MTPAELDAVRLSLVVAGAATLASAPIAIALGLLLARWQSRLRIAVEAVVMAPLVLPPVVTGYLLLLALGPNGPIGQLIERGIGVRLPFTTAGAVVAAAVVALPLFVRAVRQSVEAVEPGLEQAAATLGAPRWRIWGTITLPLAMPGVLTGALLAFARALGEFGATITFAGSLEGETRTLPLAIFRWASVPGGEAQAGRLVVLSLLIALGALVASEVVARRQK